MVYGPVMLRSRSDNTVWGKISLDSPKEERLDFHTMIVYHDLSNIVILYHK
jgi:hypothetical protein